MRVCVCVVCVCVCVCTHAGEEQSQQAKPRSAGATLGGGAPAGGTQLPLARVKLIIKTDPETSLVSHEAMLLVTKVEKCATYCIE